MKLLYITPLGGGIRDLAEAGQHKRLLQDYCGHYSREFDEVLILSFFDEKLSDYSDVKVSAKVRLLPNKGKLHRYLYAALAPWIHRKELAGTSIIRVSQTTGSLPALFMKLALKVPVVMTYGYDYVLFARIRGRAATWLAKLHERIGRWAADRWITTTAELVWLIQARHGVERERIFLIPNGVSFTMFHGAELPDPEEDLRSLIFVGRLEAQKNIPLLLECVSAAAERFQTHLKLTIVGDGSERKASEKLPTSKLLKVEFLGAVEQSRLAGLFQESQLFVIASRYEGHPKAVLEAMACGLPVLGFDAPGVTPLLKKAGQFVFDNVDNFVDNFKRLTDSATRLEASRRAHETARNDFDLEKNLVLETELLTKVARDLAK